MDTLKNPKDLTSFNFTYNFKTQSFVLSKKVYLPDIPLPSDVLKDIDISKLDSIEITR